MTAKKLWLNGMTCLSCGKGYYNGYDPKKPLTWPCDKCGHQAPQRMLPTEYRKAVEERDKRLFP